MTEIVSFPGLGLEFTLNKVALSVFGFDIYWYAVIIAFGMLAAMFYMEKQMKHSGINSDDFFDVLFISIIIGIVGARLYFVAFSWDNYKNDLMQIFNTRNGGLAIYGGIIFGVLTAFFACKKKKIPFLSALDLAGGAFLLGQGIGRWGNFMNVEAYGENTTSIFGMTAPSITKTLAYLQSTGVNVDPNMPVHPTFLYESLWCLAGFLIIALYLYKNRKYNGQVFCFYLLWYGFERMVVEDLRLDSLMIGNIKVSLMLSALLFVTATCAYVYLGAKARNKTLPEIFTPYVMPAAAADETVAESPKASSPKIEEIAENSAENELAESADQKSKEAAAVLAAAEDTLPQNEETSATPELKNAAHKNKEDETVLAPAEGTLPQNEETPTTPELKNAQDKKD